jgi:hypothetical protein
MERRGDTLIEEAREAAVRVLFHNLRGPCKSLFRTAGWGYPEPYTRDIMISVLGVLVSGEDELVRGLEKVLKELARTQTPRGHITSLAHDPNDRGASDTTPLFLIGLALFRRVTGREDFLEDAVRKALTWMDYQSPADRVMVPQQPTSDWRDEQWVWGYGLYVNTLVYTYLVLFGLKDRAAVMRRMMQRLDPTGKPKAHYVHGALGIRSKPYYSLFSYKQYRSDRFDLLGNSLAILSGIASTTRAEKIVSWTERQCEALRKEGLLALDLPPCLFPYVENEDLDWKRRYEKYNRPGEYHNGGVWPFICGFYVAAAVAAGRPKLARRKLQALAELVRPSRRTDVEFGFNEWFRAQDGTPQGQDWQTWSAAMYIYAAVCVERESTPFFDEVR